MKSRFNLTRAEVARLQLTTPFLEEIMITTLQNEIAELQDTMTDTFARIKSPNISDVDRVQLSYFYMEITREKHKKEKQLQCLEAKNA